MIGSDAKKLGVRLGEDIQPDSTGNVHPRTGGMSVAPGLRQLPEHRIPKRFKAQGVFNATGTDKLSVWTTGTGPFIDGPFAPGLFLRIDPDDPNHGTIEPDCEMPLQEYEQALSTTVDQWVINEVVT